jgi:hypothetical protein
MGEFAGFDLDRSTERAWSAFQARLADRVADLSDDEIVVVEVGSVVDQDAEGAAPYVQFCAWGDTRVRCEVSSNEYLDPHVRIDRAGVDTIVELGWSAPTARRDEDAGEGSSNFFLDAERVEGDRLAVMTTRVLRDIFGVAHPAFLVTDDLAPETSPAPPEPPVEAPATFPRDREHLQELVDAALTPFFGHEPSHDEDDDIPVVSGSAMVFVRVLEEAPIVQLFCPLVREVGDRDRAAFEVSVLNRDQRFLKFVLAGDDVMVHMYLPAYPFAPEHLRAMLALMSSSVDTLDDDLVARVGGRRMFEATDDEEPGEPEEAGGQPAAGEEDPGSDTDAIHPAMLTLLQLDADSPGSLTPELAASVCGMDRDLILELITWNSDQEIAWREARDEAILRGDAEEAEVCGQEMSHAEQAVNLLRRALRLVVERQLGRDLVDQGYVVARRNRRGSLPEKDPALPGLDTDEEPGLFDGPEDVT